MAEPSNWGVGQGSYIVPSPLRVRNRDSGARIEQALLAFESLLFTIAHAKDEDMERIKREANTYSKTLEY